MNKKKIKDSYHIRRGGSWFSYDNICTVSNRFYDNPYARYNSFGFRPVRRVK